MLTIFQATRDTRAVAKRLSLIHNATRNFSPSPLCRLVQQSKPLKSHLVFLQIRGAPER